MAPEAAASRIRELLVPSEAGAENESLVEYCRSGDWIERRALQLFHSDTDDGFLAARILAARFKNEFTHVGTTRCLGLRDDDPRLFATRGLRNLVNSLIQAIVRLRRDGCVPAIDATGGYKPQIAYAALVGQVMEAPVFYRYQDFPQVISLQPLPVSLDAQVWFDNLWFFERLREELLPDREIPHWDERIAPLLDREDRLVTLSPLGELMAGAVDRLLAGKGEELAPPAATEPPEKKKIQYEDGNAGKHAGLADFCARLRTAPFVTRIATFYFNPDLPRAISVRLPMDAAGGHDRLEVWYGDGRGLTKMSVWTTARTNRELAAARAALARMLEAPL
jgi:putative CRISPR-associated protein (TIGR02619 family)